MNFNTIKGKHMRHGVKKTHQPYTMKSGQERVSLEQVNSENDRVVIFDNKLLFSMDHIGYYTSVSSGNIYTQSAIASINIGII